MSKLKNQLKVAPLEPPVVCNTVNCKNCKNLTLQTESWEMPWVFWYECKVKPFVENLSSFPFKNTQCKEFNQRLGQSVKSLSEISIKNG